MSVQDAHARTPEPEPIPPATPEPQTQWPGPRPADWTAKDEHAHRVGQEAKAVIAQTLHVHAGGTIEGWKRIDEATQAWKAQYGAREHLDRMRTPFSRAIDRVEQAFPGCDPIEKLKSITTAYLADCQANNRQKFGALNFLENDIWKDDWAQPAENQKPATTGKLPGGETYHLREDGRYEITGATGKKAVMKLGWKP